MGNSNGLRIRSIIQDGTKLRLDAIFCRDAKDLQITQWASMTSVLKMRRARHPRADCGAASVAKRVRIAGLLSWDCSLEIKRHCTISSCGVGSASLPERQRPFAHVRSASRASWRSRPSLRAQFALPDSWRRRPSCSHRFHACGRIREHRAAVSHAARIQRIP